MRSPSPRTGNSGTRAGRAVALAIVLLLSGAQARADDPTVAPETEAEAQAAFNEGVAAAKEGRWSSAYDAFHRAHTLAPRPVVLFNLAAAEVQTGRLLAAEASYQRFLVKADGATAKSAERRAAAQTVLADLRDRIPFVRIEPRGLQAGDRLDLDGRALRWPADAEARVDPGAHTVRVLRGALALSSVDFFVREFERRTIAVVAPPPAPAARQPAAALVEPRPPAAPARSLWRSPWLWTAVGLVAAGAVGTAVLLDRRRDPFVGNTASGYVELP